MEASEATAAPQPAAPEVKEVIVERTVIDTSGYDIAIKTKEDMIERVPEDEVAPLMAEIAELRTKKVELEKSSEMAELEAYRAEKANRLLAEILPEGIDPAGIPGATAAEKMANAKALASAAAPLAAQLAELKAKMETGEPTAEQIAAHGTPMVPGGEIHTEDEAKAVQEAIKTGDMEALKNSKSVKEQLSQLWNGIKS